MKRRKNVSKLELRNNLIYSLEHNSIALDYIENSLSKAEDILKYNSDDKELLENVNTLKYIMFSLEYLDKQYNESLKRLGG